MNIFDASNCSILLCVIAILQFHKIAAQDLEYETSDNALLRRQISAVRIDEFLNIDGKFDEPEWGEIQFMGNFTQREPEFGEPATEDTRFALLYNQQQLYIGIKCFDKEPNKIIAREMRRDVLLDTDDNFKIVFDTFHDKRNGFYFAINPNGCRRDATFSDEGQSFNSEWNGIWECETEINDKGWFAEIAIPWKTLRFAKTDTLTWGMNLMRQIRRKNEEVFWQLISRDTGRLGLFRVSQIGILTGLSGMEAGGNLEIEPYIVGSSTKDATTDFDFANKSDWGFDSKLNITSNLVMNFTWNTDFAQVEADQERINLTRFSLYFPEKRDFFLDGAEIFNFGGQSIIGSKWGPGNGIRLFYSRRMGINSGYQQPINNGLKIFGKAGDYHMGLLNVLTEEMSVTDDDELKQFKANNSTVLRLRKEVLNRSSIGMMFLNKEELNSTHYNRSFGLDANFPLTDVFTLNGSLAGTMGPDYSDEGVIYKMDENNLAGNFEADYESDLWKFKLSHLNIQKNFNAEMGFTPRTNIKNTEADIAFSPRSTRFPSIRQFMYRLEFVYLTNQFNTKLQNTQRAVMGIIYQNGSVLFLGLVNEREYIENDWETRPGFLIPSDTYQKFDTFLYFRSDVSKKIFGESILSYGDYYTGKSLFFSPSIYLTSIDRFNAQFNFDINYITMPEGSFNAQTFGCRLYYYFSTRLYLKAYIQYNDDRLANDGNSISLSNLLLRWTYRPGSDFYIVYNDTRLFGTSKGHVSNRAVMLKFTYFWRK